MLFHLLPAACRHGTFFQVKIILQTDPGVATHQQCQITHSELVAAGCTHRPDKFIANDLPGRVNQKNQVVDGGRHAAQNAQYKLQVDRPLDFGRFDQKSKIVEHAGIVYFKFRFGIFGGKKMAEFPQGFKSISASGATSSGCVSHR